MQEPAIQLQSIFDRIKNSYKRPQDFTFIKNIGSSNLSKFKTEYTYDDLLNHYERLLDFLEKIDSKKIKNLDFQEKDSLVYATSCLEQIIIDNYYFLNSIDEDYIFLKHLYTCESIFDFSLKVFDRKEVPKPIKIGIAKCLSKIKDYFNSYIGGPGFVDSYLINREGTIGVLQNIEDDYDEESSEEYFKRDIYEEASEHIRTLSKINKKISQYMNMDVQIFFKSKPRTKELKWLKERIETFLFQDVEFLYETRDENYEIHDNYYSMDYLFEFTFPYGVFQEIDEQYIQDLSNMVPEAGSEILYEKVIFTKENEIIDKSEERLKSLNSFIDSYSDICYYSYHFKIPK